MRQAAEHLYSILPNNGALVQLSFVGAMVPRPSGKMTLAHLIERYYSTWFRMAKNDSFEPCVAIRLL